MKFHIPTRYYINKVHSLQNITQKYKHKKLVLRKNIYLNEKVKVKLKLNTVS